MKWSGKDPESCNAWFQPNTFWAAEWCWASGWQTSRGLAAASRGKPGLQPWGRPRFLLKYKCQVSINFTIVLPLTSFSAWHHSGGLLLLLILAKLLDVLRGGLHLVRLVGLRLTGLDDLPHSPDLEQRSTWYWCSTQQIRVSYSGLVSVWSFVSYLGCWGMASLEINCDISHVSQCLLWFWKGLQFDKK